MGSVAVSSGLSFQGRHLRPAAETESLPHYGRSPPFRARARSPFPPVTRRAGPPRSRRSRNRTRKSFPGGAEHDPRESRAPAEGDRQGPALEDVAPRNATAIEPMGRLSSVCRRSCGRRGGIRVPTHFHPLRGRPRRRRRRTRGASPRNRESKWCRIRSARADATRRSAPSARAKPTFSGTETKKRRGPLNSTE